MENYLIVEGETYPIVSAELHLPKMEESCSMFLRVGLPDKAGFDLWDVELKLLEHIDQLDGKRIHLRPGGESYDDDTLGTDIIGSFSEDSNCLLVKYEPYEIYSYGEILIDFDRIEGRKYRCTFRFTLTDSDDVDELEEDEFTYKAYGEFTVTADEKNPNDID